MANRESTASFQAGFVLAPAIPSQMFGPALLPRVEEGHENAVEGIRTFDLIICVTITRWAGQGEILQSCAPTFGPRHNMLYSKRTRHKAVRGVAIFTAPSRTRQHSLSLGWRDPFRLHTQAV